MDPMHPAHLLVGATCDMQMMQLLLDQVKHTSSSGAGNDGAGDAALQQFRAQHMLDAVVSCHSGAACAEGS